MDWKNEHPPYSYAELDDKNIVPCPWDMWNMWQKEAQQIAQYSNEIAVATSDTQGNATVRMVLLKHSDKLLGFCWYTNRYSEKGIQLVKNPKAEILWYSKKQNRQVRIRGSVTQLPRRVVETYAHSRPIKSQISALVSNQSHIIESKAHLKKLFDHAYHTHTTQNSSDIPVSKDWTGFSLNPNRFEFWQGSTERLHDRIIYKKIVQDTWETSRLAP